MDVKQRILAIQSAFVVKGKITIEEENYLLDHIDNIDLIIADTAMLTAVCFDKSFLEKILKRFDNYQKPNQYLLVTYLCGTESYLPYKFLIQKLKTTKDDRLKEVILLSLGKTDYLILPIILFELSTTNQTYLNLLKELIANIPIKNIEPLLQIFPEIPFEEIFLDILGYKVMSKIKEKKGSISFESFKKDFES